MDDKHPEFNHSRYFNFHDQENDVTGFMRIGMKPNREEKSLSFFLMIGNEVMGIKAETPFDDDSFRCQGLEFAPRGEERWSLRYQGQLQDREGRAHQVTMELDWKPLHPEFDYHRCVSKEGERISASVASEHFEQFGSLRGELSVDDRKWSISARGERDRSLGVRDWGSPVSWLWINSQFSDNEAFNLTKLVMDEGTVDSGFIYYGDVNRPLRSVKAEVTLDGPADPRSFHLTLEDHDGWLYHVEGQVLKKAEMPFQGADGTKAVIVETLAEYTWGKQKGYGIAEFMYRL
ncbi:MAG: hypothetical protein AB7E27_03335 [Candidatus Methanomethylophilaceae archaeon]